MATVLRCQSRDERRLPARHEAEIVVKCAETRKHGIHEPQLVADPGHFMDVNVAREVGSAREVAGIVAAIGEAGGDVGGRAQQPDLRPRTDGQAVWSYGDTHRPLE